MLRKTTLHCYVVLVPIMESLQRMLSEIYLLFESSIMTMFVLSNLIVAILYIYNTIYSTG